MRRTKIVATLGPATRGQELLERLLTAGVDMVRLNFSHGTAVEHGQALADVRVTAARLGRHVAVLQDLAGPKIRTGRLAAGPIELVAGQPFTLTSREVPGDDREVGLTWPTLPRHVSPGDRLLLADGALELAVTSSTETDIACRVVTGGTLGSHKGINVPGRTIAAPSLTEKDRVDLGFGVAHGVDAVALSFVRRAEDIAEARRALRAAGGDPLLIAKIEKPEALADIDGILAAADGIMVARGDLGLEIPVERVPIAQKRLIALANSAGKPVITATQMLLSMVASPRPTRAEVTDVANAILDGTDAVMLSEETAVGAHAVEAVATMDRIALEAETIFPHRTWARRIDGESGESEAEAVAFAACELALRVGAAAILTLTRSGATARFVAKHRPSQPVLALTPSEATCRRLACVWGVTPLRVAVGNEVEAMERAGVARSREAGFVRAGDKVVVTAGAPPPGLGSTNLIKIVRVG